MAYLEDIPKCALGTACELIAGDQPQALLLQQQRQQQPQHLRQQHRDQRPPRQRHLSASVTSSTGSSRCTQTGDGRDGGHSHESDYDHGDEDDGLHDYDMIDYRDLDEPPLGASRGRRPPMTGVQFKELLEHALRAGCRHLDCAPLYGTQPLVGEVLRNCASTIPRHQMFITSKVPPNMMRPAQLARSVRRSIEELQVSYLDLCLLHAPFATRYLADDNFYPRDALGNVLLDNDDQLLESAWRKLAELKRRGLARYIGLSNVNMEQVERLNDIEHVDVVQNEYHIYNQNRELFDHCEELDIHFEAYAVFGSPHKSRRDGKPHFSKSAVVRRVARAHAMSVHEVNIQWIHPQPLSYVLGVDSPHQWDENQRAARRPPLPLDDLIELDSLNRDVRVYTFADEHPGLERHCEFPFELPREVPTSTTPTDNAGPAHARPTSSQQRRQCDCPRHPGGGRPRHGRRCGLAAHLCRPSPANLPPTPPIPPIRIATVRQAHAGPPQPPRAPRPLATIDEPPKYYYGELPARMRSLANGFPLAPLVARPLGAPAVCSQPRPLRPAPARFSRESSSSVGTATPTPRGHG